MMTLKLTANFYSILQTITKDFDLKIIPRVGFIIEQPNFVAMQMMLKGVIKRFLVTVFLLK